MPPPQVKRRVIRMILEASRDVYPDEFAALLKVNKKGVIAELVFLPGTIQGRSSAVFTLYMMPITYDIAGTVHSHPTPNCTPSPDDLAFFERLGYIHIIAGYPFNMSSWQAYDRLGKKIDIVLV